MSDPIQPRDPDLSIMAEELAARRALSKLPGDVEEEPRLELAALRDHLPPPPPPWWRSLINMRVTAVAAAAAAITAFVVYRGDSPETRMKNDGVACVDVRLEAGVLAGEQLAPLESRRVGAGTKLGLEAHLGAACFVSAFLVSVDSKQVERIARLDEARTGRVALPAVELPDRGSQLLVVLSQSQRIEPSNDELLALLGKLADGASCTIAEKPCAIDVLPIEVE